MSDHLQDVDLEGGSGHGAANSPASVFNAAVSAASTGGSTTNGANDTVAAENSNNNHQDGTKKRKKKKKKKKTEQPKEESEPEEEEPVPVIDDSWRQHVPAPPEGGAEEEKRILKDMDWEAERVKKDETWFILSSRWFSQWKDFVNYDGYNYEGPRPGPISNDYLIRQGTMDYIRKDFSEGQHYEIIPERVWRALFTWYGGGPPLARSVIPSGGYGDKWAVEVRPLLLKVVKSSDDIVEVQAMFSKVTLVSDFKRIMCRRMKLKQGNVRIWDWHARNKIKLLEKMNETLSEAQIIDNQLVLLEEKDAKGNFPQASYGYGNNRYMSMYSEPSEPGLVGLSNLGNTCFMNSSLQCLANAAPLANFFLSERYKRDVNPTNPLGMKGELAEEYASLQKEIWSGRSRATAPREFKYKLEHFAPQFSGYQQHDSQELLGFLLDGLHEDLNRITQKPYVESVESNGRPDKEVADEAWRGHKSRNDSAIVDLFQGQLKSTLVCPVCAKVSITFDPFMYLSLPLPMKMNRKVKATIVWNDPARNPLKVSVTVFKYGTVADLRKALSELVALPAETLVITDVGDSKFHRDLKDSESVDMIQDHSFVFVFEVPLDLPAARGPPPPVPEGAVAETEEGEQTTTGEATGQAETDATTAPESDANNNSVAAAEESGGADVAAGTHLTAADEAAGEGPSNDTKGKGRAGVNDDDSSSSSDPWGYSDDDEWTNNFIGSSYKKNNKIPKPVLSDDALVHVCVLHRKEEIIQYRTYMNTLTTYTKKTLFGLPFVLTVRRNITYKQLYRTLMHKMVRFVKPLPEPVIEEVTAIEDQQPLESYEAELPAVPAVPEESSSVPENAAQTEVTENTQAEAQDNAAATNEAAHSQDEEDKADTDITDADTSSSSDSTSSSDLEEEEYIDSRLLPIDGKNPLFMIKATDVFGSNEQWVTENNDQPLMLDERQTLALCWNADALSAGIFDEEAEEKCDVHPSAAPKDMTGKVNKQVTLQDCIELFTQVEKLGPDDPWYCSKCQEFQQATKKFDLWRLPNILVVHLKRFSYKNRYWREKLETYVDYPEDNLDLGPYILNSGEEAPVYELYAVSNHYGSLGGGHYTAYAKNHRNSKWYSFDDSSVTEANKIHTSAAYVLFYRRKNLPPSDWRALSAEEALPTTAPASTGADAAGESDDDTSSSSYYTTSSSDGEDEEEEEDDKEREDTDDEHHNSNNNHHNNHTHHHTQHKPTDSDSGDVEMSDLGPTAASSGEGEDGSEDEGV
eukprot:TRINITY_DN1943_c0_g1_i3.p1 TRINITY_DN1943_c0_g1~~TRINITY_DN1943_c0_g1_i3.p1  ORF type:complete len:1256 (+),score=322.20 TRINITY_DN1943_c0_g1_i3:123-3890(+)